MRRNWWVLAFNEPMGNRAMFKYLAYNKAEAKMKHREIYPYDIIVDVYEEAQCEQN